MKERTPFKSERSAKFPENLGPLAQSLFTSSQIMMMSMILMVMKTMKMLTMVLSFWWSCWSSGVIANQHAWGAEEQIRASSQNSVPPSSPSVRFYSDLLLKKTQIQKRIQTQTNVPILATKYIHMAHCWLQICWIATKSWWEFFLVIMCTPIWKYEMYTSSINKNTVQQAKNNPIQWPDFLDKYAKFIPGTAHDSFLHFRPQLCPLNSSGIVFCAAHFYVSRLSFRARIAFYRSHSLMCLSATSVFVRTLFCCCHICSDYHPYQNSYHQRNFDEHFKRDFSQFSIHLLQWPL